MKHYTISFKPKRIRCISKKNILFMALFWIVTILVFIAEIIPVKYRLSNLETRTVHIDRIRMVDTMSRGDYRMKLIIKDGNTTYYLHYPRKTLKKVSQALDDDLFSGKISSVEVTVAKPSLRNYLDRDRRIVDLRSETNVYYDLEAERDRLHKDGIEGAIALALLFPFTLALTWLTLFDYGILYYRPRKHRK